MTTGIGPNQHQNEINNNSNALNIENNNQSENVSDEENTSEYSQDPSSHHTTMDSHAEYPHKNIEALDQQLINRLNNNFQSLSSSMESDNILNNNDIESESDNNAAVDPVDNNSTSLSTPPVPHVNDNNNTATGAMDANDNENQVVQDARQQLPVN